jgi:cytosine/adenosine deaminase-related metal-dependent hydrolase
MSAPAPVNAHTHLYSGLSPLGMPKPARPPHCFLEILEEVWWKLDRALDAASLRAGARLYLAEALAFGTGGLVDHHESPELIEGSLDLLADVCQELGMPAVLCYGATERNGGRDEARRGLLECRRFLRDNRRPLVRGVVGLHASFTVSDDTVREAGELARELGTVLHVHVAEDRADVVDAKGRGFNGVVDRLAQLGALVQGSILAHGVHLTPEEVRQVAAAGCWLVHNPRSNVGNKVGYAAALGASAQVALGTDGYPSDLEQELQAAAVEAQANGADSETVAAWVGGGARLLAERFGGAVEPPDASARERAHAALREIREEAKQEAHKLWARMRQVR